MPKAKFSPLGAVKEFCTRWCKFRDVSLDVSYCDNYWCPLHQIRLGYRPFGNNVSEENRELHRERMKAINDARRKAKGEKA